MPYRLVCPCCLEIPLPPYSCYCPALSWETPLGQICFSSCKGVNAKIRSLFQESLVSIPPSISFWSNFVKDIDWKKVWCLPQKFLLSNKMKEISFKLIHRFYPVKCFLQKYKRDIDTLCSFYKIAPETCSHLFWSCTSTQMLWKDIASFISKNILSNFVGFF